MSNKEIAKIVGRPLNVSDGEHTRSDNDASKNNGPRSLGKGEYLPDTGGLGYGTEGVTQTSGGRSGPTGRT